MTETEQKEINDLKLEVQELTDALKDSDKEVNELDDKIREKDKEISELESRVCEYEEIESERPDLSSMVDQEKYDFLTLNYYGE